jgi:hypothetical protein
LAATCVVGVVWVLGVEELAVDGVPFEAELAAVDGVSCEAELTGVDSAWLDCA